MGLGLILTEKFDFSFDKSVLICGIVFFSFFKVTLLNQAFVRNMDTLVHVPNLKQTARDIVSIADSIADESHSNGTACEFGGAIHRLAMEYVQAAWPLNNDGSQRATKCCGITMGGSGHGSKYNTRIAYIPVGKRHKNDYPLSSVDFKYFDGYLVDWIEQKIANGYPVATTKIRHDSGVVYDGCLILCHEARSSSDTVEIMKLLMGMCRIKVYAQVPYAWYSTAEWAHFVRLELNDENGTLEYRKCSTIYNSANEADMDKKANSVMTLIKRIAGILMTKENNVDRYMARRRAVGTGGTRDDPQKSIKTHVYQMKAQEGIFTMEEEEAEAVDIDKFGTQVLKRGWKDIREKNIPFSRRGSR